MKLKSIKINNFKSFGEVDTLLILDDVNTIIGKNESGKSNLIECLSNIDFFNGITESFFAKNNRNYNCSPCLSLVFTSTDEEKKNMGIVEDTQIEITKECSFIIKGGLSKSIQEDSEFQNNLKNILELKEKMRPVLLNSSNLINQYNQLLYMLEYATTYLFVPYNHFQNVIDTIKQEKGFSDYASMLEKCFIFLNKLFASIPCFIEINAGQLKSIYKKNEIENNLIDLTMLNHLLNCLDLTIGDIKKYWKMSQPEKEDFRDNLNKNVEKLTEDFNNFYTQEKIYLRLSIETDAIHIIVKTTEKYLKFDERSNGLKWYLNMFVELRSKTKMSSFNNNIVLIDEPGTYLHVNAQEELRNLFENYVSKNNQIIYTTHSPFMIYRGNLERTKLIIKDEKGDSHISNKYYKMPHNIKGKNDTLTPLFAALGMSNNYNLFFDKSQTNIITEGISDSYYLRALFYQMKCSNYNIIPSTGVSNIHNIVSILIGWNCNYKILLDQDKAGRTEYNVLIKKLSVCSDNIVFVDATNTPNNLNYTIENIFSENDKKKIGINNEDYNYEKAAYAYELMKKVENGEYVIDNETTRIFKRIISFI